MYSYELSCPECGSDSLGQTRAFLVCEDCGAYFTDEREYTGRPVRTKAKRRRHDRDEDEPTYDE